MTLIVWPIAAVPSPRTASAVAASSALDRHRDAPAVQEPKGWEPLVLTSSRARVCSGSWSSHSIPEQPGEMRLRVPARVSSSPITARTLSARLASRISRSVSLSDDQKAMLRLLAQREAGLRRHRRADGLLSIEEVRAKVKEVRRARPSGKKPKREGRAAPTRRPSRPSFRAARALRRGSAPATRRSEGAASRTKSGRQRPKAARPKRLETPAPAGCPRTRRPDGARRRRRWGSGPRRRAVRQRRSAAAEGRHGVDHSVRDQTTGGIRSGEVRRRRSQAGRRQRRKRPGAVRALQARCCCCSRREAWGPRDGRSYALSLPPPSQRAAADRAPKSGRGG